MSNNRYFKNNYRSSQNQSCPLNTAVDAVIKSDVNTPVMAYVPAQEWGDVYNASVALYKGTLFPILNKPFSGKMEVCCK